MSDQGTEVDIEVWEPAVGHWQECARNIRHRSAYAIILYPGTTDYWSCFAEGEYLATGLAKSDALALVRATLASGGDQP